MSDDLTAMLPVYVNSGSCLILLAFAAYAATVMPGGVKMLLHKVGLVALIGLLTFQIASPWLGYVPDASWYGAGLHANIALGLLIWRREAIVFAMCKFARKFPLAPAGTPQRRASDLMPLDETPGSSDQG